MGKSEKSAGPLSRLVGLVGLNGTTEKLLEWANTTTEGGLKLAKGKQERTTAQQAHSHETQMAHMRESHRERARELVAEATGGGARPALLIAPFYHEDTGTNASAPRFVVALRQSWLTTPWHDDLAPLAGLIDRPLHRLDVDVRAVRQALHGLPVVLVYGQVQEGGRVWPSLAAWNILPGTGDSSLHLTFPQFSLPAPDDGEALRDLGDQLGRMFALTVGNLGDWFHLLRNQRPPRLHRMLAEDESSERAFLSTSAADAYDLMVTEGQLDSDLARAHQARVLVEGGLPDLAGRMARSALGDLAASPLENATRRMAVLQELLGVFGLLGDEEHRAQAESLQEQAARRRLDQLHGWEARP